MNKRSRSGWWVKSHSKASQNHSKVGPFHTYHDAAQWAQENRPDTEWTIDGIVWEQEQS